jgi:Glutaredoxin-like domain (DUF836)
MVPRRQVLTDGAPERPGRRMPIEMTPSAPILYLYARPGCHLCDEARSIITALFAERAARGLIIPELVERDVETDPELERAYLTTIPVVELGTSRVELATSVGQLRRLLETLDVTPAATGR